MLTKSRMTLAEFLALPEEKPYREFINGEVVEKPMPNNDHGELAIHLGILWTMLLKRVGIRVSIGTEVHHVSGSPGSERIYLPDLHVTRLSRLGSLRNAEPQPIAPDLAIEIRSPSDRRGDIEEKLAFYASQGIVAWLVEPLRRVVTVCLPGQARQEFAPGRDIPAAPFESAESLSVDEIFSVLDE